MVCPAGYMQRADETQIKEEKPMGAAGAFKKRKI